MNENRFTLFTKWRGRTESVPLAMRTTRLLRFVVMLCIGLYGSNLNAQCPTCVQLNSLESFTCESEVPTGTGLLDLTNCPAADIANTMITFADVDVAGTGTGYFGSPRDITRTYTFIGNGGGLSGTCSHLIRLTSTVLNITDPPDRTVTLGSGECGAQVDFTEPVATGACGTGTISRVGANAGLGSGSFFPEGVTILTYQAVTTAFGGVTGPTQQVIITVLGNPAASNQMACNTTNVSVDENCVYEVTPANTLVGNNYGCFDAFTASVHYIVNGLPGAEIPTSPIINSDFIDQEVIVMITNPTGTNSCWHTKLVEDKMGPTIDCTPAIIDLDCGASTVPTVANTPTAIDNCEGAITPTHTEVITPPNCGANPFQIITRTWTATDSKGNTATCEQTININRPILAEIECPISRDGQPGNEDALVCNSNYPTDANGHPSPTLPLGTGEPTYNGQPINGLCMFNVTYTDLVIPDVSCPSNVTYLRTWTILDMCNAEPRTCMQTIKVADTEGPTTTCPASYAVPVGNDCTASTVLPAPTMVDACSNNANTFSASKVGPGTLTLLASGDYMLSGLLNGTTATITYIGSDECGNQSAPCSFTVTANDQTAPVASCNFATNLTLDNTGNAVLNAQSPATAGSTDNCGIASYGIRIMNDCATPAQSTYSSSVTLGCCHATPGTVIVEFQVTDVAGNTNTCSSTINVSTYSGFGFDGCPTPAVTTVECDDLTSINSALTNVVSTGTVPVTHTDINGVVNASAGFYPTSGLLLSGCGSPAVTIVDVDMSTVCGGGTIERTYTVTDGSQTSSCVVIYTVQNTNNPFDPSTIVWPLDYTSPGATCGATEPTDLPTANSMPTFTTVDGCNDVWATKSDLEIPATDAGTCFKILRTWTVSDDCNTSATPTTSSQIVMVVADAPTIPSCPGTQTLDVGGSLNLSITATNNCAQFAPVITYTIDINNDGTTTADLTGTGGTITDVVGMASSVFPVGNHTVTFSATACNSTTTCVVAVVVNDPCSALATGPFRADVGVAGSFNVTPNLFFGSAGAPAGTTIDIMNFTGTTFTCSDIVNNTTTPFTVNVTLPDGTVCPNTVNVVDNIRPAVSVSTVPVNITADGTVVFANHQAVLFPGINDECTDFADLDITYSPASVVCAGSAITQTVTITIKDEFIYGVGNVNNGNPRVESVDVIVSCSTPPSAMSSVSGSISNEANSMLENVTVTPASGMDISVTDINGAYNMNLATSQNYNVTPEKDDDYLNGVSTYDIVLMSKHILQLDLLDSPYKMIAADVNKSGSITTLDMVELRKVILFINDEFTNNTSWRFVDANYAFPDATNPFGEIFPESYAINGLNGDMEDLDFVAVKIGDVNGTAVTNGFNGDADSRDFNGTLELEMNDVQLKAGQTKTIEVKANDFNHLLGYQFTMAFDGLEVTDVTAGELTSLTAANFGMQRLQEGVLTTSWNNNEAVSLADGTVLFTVTVRATADVQLSEVLRASSQYTVAEAYADKTGAVEVMDVAFTFRDNNGATIASGFDLYQNRPNPFKNETVIGFDLPQAGKAQINVYDLSGRVLLNVSGTYTKGYNEVSINRSDLPGAGVLYYELTTEHNSAVRKMTIIE